MQPPTITIQATMNHNSVWCINNVILRVVDTEDKGQLYIQQIIFENIDNPVNPQNYFLTEVEPFNSFLLETGGAQEISYMGIYNEKSRQIIFRNMVFFNSLNPN